MKTESFLLTVLIGLLSVSSLLATTTPKDFSSSFVTTAEYCDFLSAVAPSDPHHLYDEKMMTDPSVGSIERYGDDGSYEYHVVKGHEKEAITYVNWFDQARFCNWLENGKRSGEEGAMSTEYGAYTLSDEIGEEVEKPVSLNQGAHYSIEEGISEESDPWVKANQSFFCIAQLPQTSLLKPSIPLMACCASEGVAEEGYAVSLEALWESFWANWMPVLFPVVNVAGLVALQGPEILLVLAGMLAITLLPVLPIPGTGNRNFLELLHLGGTTLADGLSNLAQRIAWNNEGNSGDAATSHGSSESSPLLEGPRKNSNYGSTTDGTGRNNTEREDEDDSSV